MKRYCLAAGTLVIGMVIGIFVQHRWPLGRLLAPVAPAPTRAPDGALAEVSGLAADRRRVFVVVGQSNAANYGSTRRDAGPGVYAFAEGRLQAAIDPLPGGDGIGGSPWTRLGASLLAKGRADAVVFAVAARGSSRAADWAPSGALHGHLRVTLAALAAAGLPVDAVLWQQGESEGSDPLARGTEYLEALRAVIASCRELAPGCVFLVARASFMKGAVPNEQIRAAQEAAGRLPGAAPGPDLDALGAEYRSDGVHFNDRGLEAVAAAWLACMPGEGGPR